MLNVKQVNKQGQISIGKKYAGKKVRIDEYPDGNVVLKPAEIISEFEMKLLKSKVFQDPVKDGLRSAQIFFGAKPGANKKTKTPKGSPVCAIHITRSFRAILSIEGDYLRFISLDPGHDSAY